ncbi:collagen alpha-2(I) chain-like [Pipra filicauda]|uniref:Collagen alpha-2(I) chain-like n=1 Tax=Pipra filicauda TaxID=649802 RepID=A0A7R5K559_9PASS|nr:collagen alpha-2(I) chain-like [Pipra filicauda]
MPEAQRSSAPRLPSAFPSPRGEREKNAAGQEVGPQALPAAGLPVPPLCPVQVPEPRRHVAGRAERRSGAEGAVEGGGRARPVPRQVLRPSRTAGAAGGREQRRLGLRRRRCPRDGAVRRRRRRDGSGGWSRPPGAAAGSGPAAMKPGPRGKTGALACGSRLPLSACPGALAVPAAAAAPAGGSCAAPPVLRGRPAPIPPATVPSQHPGISALRGGAGGRRAGVPQDCSVRPGRSAPWEGCRPAGAVAPGSHWAGGRQSRRRERAPGGPSDPARHGGQLSGRLRGARAAPARGPAAAPAVAARHWSLCGHGAAIASMRSGFKSRVHELQQQGELGARNASTPSLNRVREQKILVVEFVLSVPGTGARSSERSRSPSPGGGPPAPGLRWPPHLLLIPRLQPAVGPSSHPRSRLAVPGQGWHFGGGSPCPCRGGERHESFGRGEGNRRTAFRGRAGGRVWDEGMISLTLPWDPLLLPAALSGAAWSPPGHQSARRAVSAARREGGALRGRRRPLSRGDLTLLLVPGQHRDGCVRAQDSRCCPPDPPQAFVGRTKPCLQGCPVAVMLPTTPVTAWSRARRAGRRRGPTWGRPAARRKRDRPAGRQDPPHREKLLSPWPGEERLREGPLRRSPPGGTREGGRRLRGRTGCVGPTRAPGLNVGGSFAPPRCEKSSPSPLSSAPQPASPRLPAPSSRPPRSAPLATRDPPGRGSAPAAPRAAAPAPPPRHPRRRARRGLGVGEGVEGKNAA